MLDGLFTTPVHSRSRSRLVNSSFSNKKIWPKNRSLFMRNKFESKCLQKFYVSSKQEKECYRKTTSYIEQPRRHILSPLHAKNDTENLFGHKLGEPTDNRKQQSTTSSQVKKKKQFKILTVPFKRCMTFADCRLQTADFRLQTADCRLQTADRRPHTADHRLQIVNYKTPKIFLIKVTPSKI